MGRKLTAEEKLAKQRAKAKSQEAADCFHCGARAGAPCLDFKGQPKEPCNERGRADITARKLQKKADWKNARALQELGGDNTLLTDFYGGANALLAAEGVKKVSPDDLIAARIQASRFREDSGHAEWELRASLNWITIRYMRREAAKLIGAEWEAKLWDNCERVFRTNLEHISSRYCNALTRGEKINLAHELRFDPARVKTTVIPRGPGDERPPLELKNDGWYLTVTETWPPEGYTPVMTYEEFRSRFDLKGTFWTAPTDLPEHDDGGLFERVMCSIAGNEPAG